MSKVVDTNGYWEIKHNPISKAGVFPYMGRSISDDCEPDKVYYVYRSPETLKASTDTWDNPPKPFINDHEMLGEGFAKIDERPVQGVIHNPVFENDTLYADISVYSESLKDKIANGKKELSLGYFCKYRKEKGVYKGQAYDYVQEDMVGNHIALVDNGRCGSDVKVFDSKCTMDSLDISADAIEELKTKAESAMITTTEEKDSEMKEEEKKEVEVKDEELEEKEIKEVKDEDKEEKETKDCSKAKDEDEEKKETEDEEVSPADVMAFLKMILEEVRSLNGKKTTDEDEEKKEEKAEDEDEEKKESEDEDDDKKESEDEDEDSEKKKSEDSADVTITFAKDRADRPVSMMDDPALRKYLGI